MNLNRRDCRKVHHIFVLLDQDVRKFRLQLRWLLAYQHHHQPPSITDGDPVWNNTLKIVLEVRNSAEIFDLLVDFIWSGDQILTDLTLKSPT